MKSRMTLASLGAVALVAMGAGSASAQLQSGPEPVAAAAAADAVTNGLGTSAANLVFTAVPPCRIVNTLLAGGILTGGSTRSFFVGGTTGFDTQGGNAGGCGIPADATAVAMNFIAVAPAGAGDLRAYPYNATPTVPNASVINYDKIGGLNIANGVIQPVCDASVTTCTFALIVQADVSSTHVIIDVAGYYRKVDNAIGTNTFSATGSVAGDNYYFPATTYVPPQDQKCHVDAALALAAAGAAPATGFAYVRVALRNETAGTNANIPFGHYISFGGQFLSAASNNTVALTKGTTYKFGCHLTASGDFANAGHTFYCNASYVCQ